MGYNSQKNNNVLLLFCNVKVKLDREKQKIGYNRENEKYILNDVFVILNIWIELYLCVY